MAIENEIVRFIAEMELDPQDQAAFVEGLKKTEEQCESLRKAISDTGNQMAKLRAEGKENSDEFQKLEKRQKNYISALKSSTKEANSYSAALNLNQMSIKQLQQHAKSLRSALISMHKETNPQLWDKYNQELIQTKKRLSDLEIGAEQTKGGLKKFIESYAGGFSIASITMSGISSAMNLLKKGFNDFILQTQVWGDRWAMAQAKVSAGWNQFIANIGQGKDVMKASISDAVKAAEEAQLLMDELFERNNSLRLTERKYNIDINKQQAIIRDTSKSDEERMAAVKQVIELENKLAEIKKSVAEQEVEATLVVLKERTKLTKTQLETVIDDYELNRENLLQAQKYNRLLDEREEIQKHIKNLNRLSTNSEGNTGVYDKEIAKAQKSLDETIQEISAITDSKILELAGFLSQYDLANDDLVSNYVIAKDKLLMADDELSRNLATLATRQGRLVNQMNAANKEAADKAYEDAISTAEKTYNEQLNSLKSALLAKEITEAEYRMKSTALELSFLNQKIAINKSYGNDVSELEGELYDKRLASQQQFSASFKKSGETFAKDLKKSMDEADKAIERMMDDLNAEVDKLNDNLSQETIDEFDRLFKKANTGMLTKDAKLAESDAYYNSEMADLEKLHEMKLISEEEYLARKTELARQHSQEVANIESEGWVKALGVANEILDKMSSAVSSAREAEYASLEAWKERELTAAGDSAEAREEIEAEYEAKKLDLQKKYADMDMGIQIAKAIAAGALASIQAWNAAGGNPVLAGIFMALIAATTAAQVATIIAQRNAIKNASPDTSGTAASGNSVAVGFSEGGYTGDGGRMEVAGVVHRGEYVVPQPELRDPYVRSVVAAIESRRRLRTSRNALPGFAEGGFTSNETSSGVSSADSRLLRQILKALQEIKETPIPAYTVLSEQEGKKQLRDRFRSYSSLRRP